jgi:hypothetical protein
VMLLDIRFPHCSWELRPFLSPSSCYPLLLSGLPSFRPALLQLAPLSDNLHL